MRILRTVCLSAAILFAIFIVPSHPIPICNSTSEGNRSYCIFNITDAKTFQDAQAECQKYGSNLATLVLTQDVENVFQAITSVKMFSSFWIGLHDMTVSHSYQWISGYPSLPKAYWDKGVALQNSDKLCVTMSSSGKALTSWQMESCSRALPFICGPTPSISTDHVTPNNATCPDGFDRILNRCFKFFGGFNSTLLSWNAARNSCQSLHEKSDLASILSMDEQNFMTTYMSTMLHNVWIGLNLTNGERIWTSGANVTFTNWKPGEPNNVEKTSCTVIYSRLVNLGQWNDERCDKESGYVCETPLQNISSSSSSAPPPSSLRSSIFQQNSCLTGFMQFENTCYQFLPSVTELTLEDAWKSCSELNRDQHTFLFTPHTQGENAFLRAFLSQERFLQSQNNRSVTWIGTKWKLTSGGMIWNHSDQSNLNDADLFGNFIKYRYGVQRDVEYCFLASSQLDYIKMVNCSRKILIQPLCAYKLPSHPENKDVSNLVCPSLGDLKWKPYGRDCYGVSNMMLSFEAAEASCLALAPDKSSHLASIHSAAEMNLIKTILTDRKDVWIGLTVHDTVQSTDRVGYSFSWTDNSAFQYYAFRAGEPSLVSNTGANERCVVIRANSYEWNDVVCNMKNLFVCKTKAVEAPPTTISPTSPTPTPPSSSCDGYYINNMGCLKAMSNKVDWFTAESNCAIWNKDAHLLNFHSYQEMKDFASYLETEKDLNQNSLWLGGSWNEFSNAPSHWSDGSSMNYVGVYSRDANVPLGSQLCLTLNPAYHSTKNNHAVYSPLEVTSCFTNLNHICLKRDNIAKELPNDLVPSSETLVCPSGYVRYGKFCFKLFDKPVKFYEAKKECSQTSGGELAFPSSWAENLFLSSLSGSTSHYAVWIGVYVDAVYAVFRTTSSPASNYTFFIPPVVWPFSTEDELKHLLDENVLKGVALINNNNPYEQGRWVIQKMNKTFPFICRIAATLPNSQVHEVRDVASSSCNGPTYALYNGACYSLHVSSSARDYTTARDYCRQVHPNANLLFLTSSFEEHFVVSWLMKIVNSTKPLHPQLSRGKFSVWLDIQLPAVNVNTSEWFWKNGDPVLFTHFPIKDSQFKTANTDRCMVLDIEPSVAFHMRPGVSCRAPSISSNYVATVCKRLSVSRGDNTGAMQAVRTISNDCFNWSSFSQELLPSKTLYSVMKADEFHMAGYQNISVRQSRSGKPCWRWDLLPGTNMTSKNAIVSTAHGYYPMSIKYGGRGYRSYLSNRCSMFEEVIHPHTQVSVSQYSYGCFISSTQWEACDVVSCSFKTESSFILSVILLFILFLSFAIIGGIIYTRYRHKLCFRYTPLHRYPMGRQPMFSSLHETPDNDNDNNQHDNNEFNGTAFYNPTYQPFA